MGGSKRKVPAGAGSETDPPTNCSAFCSSSSLLGCHTLRGEIVEMLLYPPGHAGSAGVTNKRKKQASPAITSGSAGEYLPAPALICCKPLLCLTTMVSRSCGLLFANAGTCKSEVKTIDPGHFYDEKNGCWWNKKHQLSQVCESHISSFRGYPSTEDISMDGVKLQAPHFTWKQIMRVHCRPKPALRIIKAQRRSGAILSGCIRV